MNFFKAQDKARKNTTRLIFLFILAIVSLVVLTNILIIGTFAYMDTGETDSFYTVFNIYLTQNTVLVISVGVSLLIIIGSIYKVISLSKGGPAIAELLGGQLVPQSTSVLEERKLLNIVEEMSIAAGMPIPKVYLLDEASINAFAAGQSHSNAVIGVTKGAIKQLSRDELQGVIAHEFSHILNGDMRLNLRLMGILHGILLIGIIGEHIINSFRNRSSGKKDGGGAIIVIGLGLMVIGYAGTFFGKWIKASVSRQREFLADASAVQFTRDKNTIAGALKKIGGLEAGSLLEIPSAPEYSHAYFANGVSSFFESILATHPPLNERIKKIDPGWNGRYINPKQDTEEKVNTQEANEKHPVAGMAVTATILTGIDQVVSQIGTISESNIEYAQQFLTSLPDAVRSASQNPYSARALVYALLILEQNDKNNALKLVEEHADKGMPELTKALFKEIKPLDENQIFHIFELCVNALRELSEKQYVQFKHTINSIITADKSIDLYEWVIQRLILQQLDEHFGLRKPKKEKHAYLGAVKNEAETILSLIAYTEHKDDVLQAEQSFKVAIKEIGANAFKILPKSELSLQSLNQSLDQLMQLKPVLKSRILKACAALIMSDGNTTRRGIELFRTISSNLDCPVPPINI